MNLHTFYDQLSVNLAATAFRDFRFFSDSLDSADLQTHIQSVELNLPDFNGEGAYELTARTLAGELDPAFRIAQWLGPDRPTLIYHHGNNERPFDFGPASKNTFKKVLLSGREPFPANLIALRAPFHRDLKLYMRAARRLEAFAAMLAASTRLAEALAAALHERYRAPVIVAGISLGGWVTNLHKTYFDSAEAYAPLLAGAALDEVFLSSIYHKLAGENALTQPERVRAALNFENDYARLSLENVFPLLARHDRIVEYEKQKVCYRERPVELLEKGHTTATLAYGKLRKHLEGVVREASGVETQHL